MLCSVEGGTRELCLISVGRRPFYPLNIISKPSRIGILSLSGCSGLCGRRMYLEQDQPKFQAYPDPEALGLSFLMYKMADCPVCMCVHVCLHACLRIIIIVTLCKYCSNLIINVTSFSYIKIL